MRTEGTRTFWSPDLVSRPAKLDLANSELPFTHYPRPITGASVGLRHFRPLTDLRSDVGFGVHNIISRFSAALASGAWAAME
jgi:hypothetical protein